MTRLAAIAEIHGNAASLDVVLESVWAAGAERLLICGGLTFGGPDPAGVLDLVRELEEDGALVVSGTSDLAVADFDFGLLGEDAADAKRAAAEWTHEALGPERVDWMRRLPSERRVWLDDVLVFLAQRPSEAIMRPGPGTSVAFGTDARVVCRGGTHTPSVRTIAGRLVVDPGSAGLPSAGAQAASWALIETRGTTVNAEIVQVPFDFSALAEVIAGRGLPGDEARAALFRAGAAT